MTPYLIALLLAAVAGLSDGERCDLSRCHTRLMPYAGSLNDITPEQLPGFCREARLSLDCMDEVVGECDFLKGHVANFDDVVSGMCVDIDSDEDEDDDLRRGVVCSFRKKGKIQRCAHRLQRLVYEQPIQCWKVRRTIGCLQRNIAKCPSVFNPAVIRLDALRSNLLAICEETEAPSTRAPATTPEPPTTAPTECPFQSRIEVCLSEINGYMQVLTLGEPNTAEACRSLPGAIECVSNYTEACNMGTQFNALVDQFRTQASSLCPGTDGGEGGCPSNYQRSLLECIAPLQEGNNPDLSAICSMARTAFDCVDNLVTLCGNAVGPMLQQMRYNQSKQNLMSICPA
ncbi:uncharacterized protein [Haliotis asinina]|uniref:uncharacterized protein isoform X2 n=1 Tax=Haliotis asinina TaxID=109174 RepID=UPI00353209D6